MNLEFLCFFIGAISACILLSYMVKYPPLTPNSIIRLIIFSSAWITVACLLIPMDLSLIHI